MKNQKSKYKKIAEKTDRQFKLAYISGLKDIVLAEIKNKTNFEIVDEDKDAFYINYVEDHKKIQELKTISRLYLVERNKKYNPLYISNHKSILGELVSLVINKNVKNSFKSFKINCAGSDSKEILSIKEFLSNEFKIVEQDDADLKIYIAKIGDLWEVGLQTTPKPLSVRDYKIKNLSGAMNPTVAHSLNYLCQLEKYKTYLNIFSGSGTLMIEAGLNYNNLEKIVGFDNNKESLSSSIQNIKKAGLIKKAEIKECNIFDKPNLGKFDVITSDLPFGMAVSKGEDLTLIYQTFIEYCEKTLNHGGRLGVYTSEFKIFEKLIPESSFKLVKEIKIDLMTNENEYLPIKIMILQL